MAFEHASKALHSARIAHRNGFVIEARPFDSLDYVTPSLDESFMHFHGRPKAAKGDTAFGPIRRRSDGRKEILGPALVAVDRHGVEAANFFSVETLFLRRNARDMRDCVIDRGHTCRCQVVSEVDLDRRDPLSEGAKTVTAATAIELHQDVNAIADYEARKCLILEISRKSPDISRSVGIFDVFVGIGDDFKMLAIMAEHKRQVRNTGSQTIKKTANVANAQPLLRVAIKIESPILSSLWNTAFRPTFYLLHNHFIRRFGCHHHRVEETLVELRFRTYSDAAAKIDLRQRRLPAIAHE